MNIKDLKHDISLRYDLFISLATVVGDPSQKLCVLTTLYIM